uniref:Ferrous iron transport protein B n=1 Tax=Candidatus Magnetananas rongchengensis TaxID=1463558 RepID=A0A3Q8BS63_9BACT|nr:magnetosome protein Mad17 [Candidatus Magnetananas rongchenensis]
MSNQVKKVMIVGLPNTGKSLIFTNLTGKYTISANSPLTTITFKTARISINDETFEIIDTPALSSIYMHSEEELKVREFIFNENPSVIVQCIDANRLKQSLALTADLLEMKIPLVICLNAIDETSRKGIWIDSDRLSQTLGVPVVESMAVYGQGTRFLKEAILQARYGNRIRYGEYIDDRIEQITSHLPADIKHKRIISRLVLMGDRRIDDYLVKKCGVEAALELKNLNQDVRGNNRIIADRKSKWTDDIADAAIKKQKVVQKEFSKTVASLCRHPIFGIPIFLMVLYTMFLLVVNVANVIAEWMTETFWTPVETYVAATVPAGFWNDFLIGDYGLLSLGLANALLTVLPILSVFFVLFNVLEDVGYIPNLSVLTKRILDKLGMSGDSIMPLVLGFGCKTMATMTTRTLRSKKERYIAIYLIAFAIPCAAQMGLNMSILGRMGAGAFLITFSVLTAVEVIAGLVLNKTLKEEDESVAFIQELPAIRMPNVKNVLKKTYYRIYWFLKESLAVFVYAALALFVIDRTGLLTASKEVFAPVVEGFLGLPIQMVDAIILCIARHEAAAAMIITLIRKGELNYIQSIVAVALTTMLVPCFANIMAMVKEVGAKNAIVMIICINMSAFLTSGALNWALLATMI